MASLLVEQPKQNGSGMTAAGSHDSDRLQEDAQAMPTHPPPAYSLTTSSTYQVAHNGSNYSGQPFDLEAQSGGAHLAGHLPDDPFQQNPSEKASNSALRLRGGCCCCDCLYDLLRCLLCCCIFEAICDMCC
ncbi:hypothetical protein VP01_189g7 [Puccinia sorghi]|uniref:Cysteine-rich transmembrane CYSTM domain-containing protein n=1 Tax=Puccinia sorghi TaxID=27349 RepID=A0A0L6VCX2_9BASI|nr:hypothetical protein VP01_189g7 [Puccinia sorghi]